MVRVGVRGYDLVMPWIKVDGGARSDPYIAVPYRESADGLNLGP